MTYTRVAPRDLFNESKLLKCLGQLALLIHEGKAPEGLTFEDNGMSYRIEQRDYDGGIECRNGITFYYYHHKLCLYHPLNVKEPYPLLLDTSFNVDGGTEYDVFYDDGSISDDFLTGLKDF